MPPPPPRRAKPRQQQAAPEQPRLTLREFRRRLGPLDRRRVRREAAQAAREAERAALAAGVVRSGHGVACRSVSTSPAGVTTSCP